MKTLKISLLILIVISISGCASIVSSAYYYVNFSSSPSNATIAITNRYGETVYNGTTPTRVNLKASADFFTPEQYLATITFEGYQSTTILVRCLLDEWYWLNGLFGPYGALGFLIIDPATGAMYKVEKENYNAVLNKLNIETSTPSAKGERNIHILNYQDLDQEIRHYLIPADAPLD